MEILENAKDYYLFFQKLFTNPNDLTNKIYNQSYSKNISSNPQKCFEWSRHHHRV